MVLTLSSICEVCVLSGRLMGHISASASAGCCPEHVVDVGDLVRMGVGPAWQGLAVMSEHAGVVPCYMCSLSLASYASSSSAGSDCMCIV
jgi:hypothetical protein